MRVARDQTSLELFGSIYDAYGCWNVRAPRLCVEYRLRRIGVDACASHAIRQVWSCLVVFMMRMTDSCLGCGTPKQLFGRIYDTYDGFLSRVWHPKTTPNLITCDAPASTSTRWMRYSTHKRVCTNICTTRIPCLHGYSVKCIRHMNISAPLAPHVIGYARCCCTRNPYLTHHERHHTHITHDNGCRERAVVELDSMGDALRPSLRTLMGTWLSKARLRGSQEILEGCFRIALRDCRESSGEVGDVHLAMGLFLDELSENVLRRASSEEGKAWKGVVQSDTAKYESEKVRVRLVVGMEW